jgi:hypothetical protein
MNELYKYKDTITEYAKFLQRNKYDVNAIFSGTFTQNIGLLLEFLETKQIFCTVDNYNIFAYTTDRKYVKENETIYILKETSETIKRGVVRNYKIAISKCFDSLEYLF